MTLRSLAVVIPLALTAPAFAQDLENDSPANAPEASQVPPASDLNDAVDQLSKEQKPAGIPRPVPPAQALSPDEPSAHHGPAKAFAQKSKSKPPKHKPVKVAKKPKTKKGGKAAKKKKHS